MPDLDSFYEQKDTAYFRDPGKHLARLINRCGLKVLDVGCGTGAAGKELLRDGKASWVTGIERVSTSGEMAETVLSEVHIGDVEEMSFPWPAAYFDCFVFGDVLEHLGNPWGLLRRLRPFLADDGIVVASIPNVKHWPVITNLILHDDWRYEESGVLDITHLRFFTRSSTIRLFAEGGYSVDAIQPYFNGRRYSILNQVTFGFLAGFFAERWLVRLNAA